MKKILILLCIVIVTTVFYFPDSGANANSDYYRKYTIKELSEIAEKNNGMLPYELTRDSIPYSKKAEGNEKWCILLVDFQDAKHALPNSYFEEQMITGRNSLSQYYLLNSYGNVKIDTGSKAIGPVKISGSKDYKYVNDMVNDAFKSAKDVDGFSYFDDNGDGYPDNCIVVFPGEWSMITGYVIPTNAYRSSQGTVVFTQGNILADKINWPFILAYVNITHNIDVLQNPDSVFVGSWDLMDQGSYKGNIGLCSYSKFKVGWMDIKEITKPGEYAVDALGGDGPDKAYKIPIPGTEKEYILIENRQKIGSDALLSGVRNEGIVIYHLNEKKSEENSFNWTSENDPYPGLQVLDRSGTGEGEIVSWEKLDAYLYKPGAVFSIESRRTSIDSSTVVNTLPYGKTKVRETITIYDISKSGAKMTFKLRYDKPTMPIVNVDETLPFAKVEKGKTKTMKLNFRNIGSGNIKVYLKSSVPWITLDRANFIGTDEDIEVTVETKSLKYGMNLGYITYSGTSEGQVKITVDVAPITGDINLDSAVDDIDIDLLRQHLGENKSQITFDRVYDLDKNGEVNGGDLIALAKNYKTRY